MRQVPCNYLVIGNGRLAQHMCYYLQCLGLPYQQWARNSDNCPPLSSALTKSSHVLLLISDNALEAFIVEHSTQFADKIVVHCSGSLVIENAYSAHPLMTFNKQLYTDPVYRTIPFIIEQEGIPFSELLPHFPNPHFCIKRADKAYYHTLCVMANNFSTILWQKLLTEFEHKLALPASIATPFMQQATTNLINHYQSALTGPLARGDTNTVQKNIHSLIKADDSFVNIYAAFCQLFNLEIHHDYD